MEEGVDDEQGGSSQASVSAPQATIQRQRRNCKVCRRRGKACNPRDRTWSEGAYQKCTYCGDHGYECGPNLTKAEEEIRDRQQETHHLGDDGLRAEHAGEEPVLLAFSSDRFREQALSKLININTLAAIHEHYSLVRYYLTLHGYSLTEPFQSFDTLLRKVVEELHTSFRELVEQGFLAAEKGLHDLAQSLFCRLLQPMDENRILYDHRKRESLLRIAEYFKKHELVYEATRIFERITCIQHLPAASDAPNPQCLLAKSYKAVEELAGPVIRELWTVIYGNGQIPAHCNLPAWHRAAGHPTSGLASAVLEFSGNQLLTCDILDQNMLHSAAALGSFDRVNDALSAGIRIDSRDRLKRTALIIAATNGYAQLCSYLLSLSADPNDRDCLFRTVLELAAAQGHLDVVKVLVDSGAEVNPNFSEGTTTPLLAAIRSHGNDRDNLSIMTYLLDKEADVHVTPLCETYNAVFAAKAKGLEELAADMELRQPENPYIWAPPLWNNWP